MFFSFFLLVVTILGVIAGSASSMLDQSRSTAYLTNAATAFYVTESTLEESLLEMKRNKNEDGTEKNTLIRSFQKEQDDATQRTGVIDIDGLQVHIVERKFEDQPTRLVAQTPQSSDEFRFVDISRDHAFSEIEFFFQKQNEDVPKSGLIFEVIAFPRSYFDRGDAARKLNFGTVKELSINVAKNTKSNTDIALTLDYETTEARRNIRRMMYYTAAADAIQKTAGAFAGITIGQTSVADTGYEQGIKIRGLDTNENNYIFRFQTVKRELISYAMRGSYNGASADLEVTNQLLEVDSSTATQHMYQRLKVQQASFAPLQPGLGFALFSDQPINK